MALVASSSPRLRAPGLGAAKIKEYKLAIAQLVRRRFKGGSRAKERRRQRIVDLGQKVRRLKNKAAVPFRIEGLPVELRKKVVEMLPLSEIAALRCVNQACGALCIEAMMPVDPAITKIRKDGAQYAASSLSELARKDFKDKACIKARHDALVDHFNELSLSPNTTPLKYAAQLKQLAELEGRYNYIVLAHKIGTQCGQEAGLVSYDALRDRSAEELKELIRGFPNKEVVWELSLCGVGLTMLPEDLHDLLPGLEDLYLVGNAIDGCSLAVVNKLNNLQKLLLHDNQLRVVPERVLDGLGNLQWLWLGGDRLSGLSGSVFDGLANLEYLGVSSDQLTPEEARVLQGLRVGEDCTIEVYSALV